MQDVKAYRLEARDSQSITLLNCCTDETEKVEILKVIEFSSERKMMSVVARIGDDTFTFSKGADSAIIARAKDLGNTKE